jgi:hypothetical protein
MWLRAQTDTYGGNDDSTPVGVCYRQPRYLVIMSICRPEALRPRLSTGLPFQWKHLTGRQMFSQMSVIQDTHHQYVKLRRKKICASKCEKTRSRKCPGEKGFDATPKCTSI